MPLDVELVSPERIAYSGEAKMVICRTTTGDIAFLPGHVPFIGVLSDASGAASCSRTAASRVIAVHQGFVEVSPTEEGATRVTILSDVRELADAIDTARAEAAKARAEEALRADPDDVEAQDALKRAEVRLEVAAVSA